METNFSLHKKTNFLISDVEMIADIFDGPQLRSKIKNCEFEKTMDEIQNKA